MRLMTLFSFPPFPVFSREPTLLIGSLMHDISTLSFSNAKYQGLLFLTQVSKSILELTGEVSDRADIGMSLKAAADLMIELESFKSKTKVSCKIRF